MFCLILLWLNVNFRSLRVGMLLAFSCELGSCGAVVLFDWWCIY